MKKILFCTAIVLSCCTIYWPANAQKRVILKPNIFNQPDWGPIGYDHADYYYIPGIDVYYDVNNHQFILQQDKKWVHAATLPHKFNNYDLYHNYKLVINNEREPWTHHEKMQGTQEAYKNAHDQEPISESHDKRYLTHWRGK